MVASAPAAIQFFVSGKPQTKGSLVPSHLWGPMQAGKPTCRIFLREDRGARLSEWRALVATSAKRAMRHEMPYEGALEVTLHFWFDRPASHTKLQRLVAWVFTKGRDDADKLARAVLDALTDAAVWQDDGQVAALHVYKLYTAENDRPGVQVQVGAL